jgi:hypothetical protein
MVMDARDDDESDDDNYIKAWAEGVGAAILKVLINDESMMWFNDVLFWY